MGSRRTIVGGGLVELHGPPDAFYHAGSNEVRLVKWMFTTVFVTPDGQKAVEGLIYSPEKNF